MPVATMMSRNFVLQWDARRKARRAKGKNLRNGAVVGTPVSSAVQLGPVKKALDEMNEDYISIRSPDPNKIILQVVFYAPLGDFKDQFLDDHGTAPRDVHLRHRHQPYYAGASLPLGQRATLQERPHQLLAITHVKHHPRPSGYYCHCPMDVVDVASTGRALAPRGRPLC
jgi:hypothetical protein